MRTSLIRKEEAATAGKTRVAEMNETSIATNANTRPTSHGQISGIRLLQQTYAWILTQRKSICP